MPHAHTRIQGDEGVDIDVREGCGCEMGDSLENNSKAGNKVSESIQAISYVISEILLVWTEGPRAGRLQLKVGLTQT